MTEKICLRYADDGIGNVEKYSRGKVYKNVRSLSEKKEKMRGKFLFFSVYLCSCFYAVEVLGFDLVNALFEE